MPDTGKAEYIELAVAAYVQPSLTGRLNRADPNLTVCPNCGVDDFSHVASCPVLKEIDERVAEI